MDFKKYDQLLDIFQSTPQRGKTQAFGFPTTWVALQGHHFVHTLHIFV